MAHRLDNIGFGGFRIVQDPEVFCYGVDAVLLADFAATMAPAAAHAADLGTGNGIIPLILASKSSTCTITGIDLFESNIELARESAALNHLEDRLTFQTMDVVDVPEQMDAGSMDLVVCNPPYFAKGGGITSKNPIKSAARQETTASVEDFVWAAAHLLEDRGHFCMIHRPSRLVDILHACREARLEPKELRYIAPREGQIPNMVLIHCIKGAGHELKLLKTMSVHGEGTEYTREILRIYGREV